MRTETMQGRRRLYAILATGVAILLGSASAAFACSAQPKVSYSSAPESAAPGETVTVQGQWVRGEAPVEIRWNSVHGSRLALATPTGGSFEVPVQVPDTAPGVYSLMLVTADGSVARTAFEVTGAPGTVLEQPAINLWASPDAGRAASHANGPLNLGMTLLALGLIGLFAGTTVAVTQRRRAPVGLQK